MGGEKCCCNFHDVPPLGSPPRGRGKVSVLGGAAFCVGITPAWAGKSSPRSARNSPSGDHPRVGGEKLLRGLGRCSPGGSPPRGRGKVEALLVRLRVLGITPAWAGKRPRCLSAASGCRDHPRVGGEKVDEHTKDGGELGSPPRGRGKEHPLPGQWPSSRITPAWAGKRLKRSHRSGIFISGPIPFHSVLHRPAGSGGSRAGRDGSPAGQPQNTGPA